MSKEPELLPCPFCGGEPEIAEFDFSFFVICEYVDAHPMVGIQAQGITKEEAVKSWNTRTPQPPSSKE